MSPKTWLRPGNRSRRMGRDEALYWWGQTTSALGSVFTAIALPIVAVVHLHATPGQIALISAASILPALLFGLPAGALADRIKRPRRTLVLLDTASALAVGALAVGLAAHAATLVWLAVLGVVSGAVSVLVEVIYFLHLRQLVGTDGVGPARARLQAGQYGAGFVGRLLAGPAIVLFGSAAALAVDATSYLLSVTALLSMRPLSVPDADTDEEGGSEDEAGAKESPLSGVFAGVRFFLRDRSHRRLLTMIMSSVVASGGVGVLTAPFLLRVVHVPSGGYGLVFAFSGLTGLAGSAVAARWVTPDRDPRRLVTVTFALAVACALLVPLSSGPLPLAMACAAAGMALPVFFGAISNVALGPLIIGDTPEDAVGRVFAALQVIAGFGGLAGTFLGGFLGDAIGIRPAMWTLAGGAATAVAVMVPLILRDSAPAGEATAEAAAVVSPDSALAHTTG